MHIDFTLLFTVQSGIKKTFKKRAIENIIGKGGNANTACNQHFLPF